jgi:hypothetical protein
MTYISLIRYRTSSLIRFDGAKWIIFCSSTLTGQQIEKRTFSHIGKSNTTHFKIVLDAPEGNDVVRRFFHCLFGRHFDFKETEKNNVQQIQVKSGTIKVSPTITWSPRLGSLWRQEFLGLIAADRGKNARLSKNPL